MRSRSVSLRVSLVQTLPNRYFNAIQSFTSKNAVVMNTYGELIIMKAIITKTVEISNKISQMRYRVSIFYPSSIQLVDLASYLAYCSRRPADQHLEKWEGLTQGSRGASPPNLDTSMPMLECLVEGKHTQEYIDDRLRYQ